MATGIDTSDYNTINDYAAAAASGMVQFWFNKATEGIHYVNPHYKTLHDAVKAQGIPYGAYHFFHGAIDGAAQAQAFLNVINGYEGQLLPFVDCEDGGRDGVTADTYLSQLAAFITAVDATLSGKRTIIYFGFSFWQSFLGGSSNFAGHPAFPAAYNDNPDLNMSGTGWKGWTLWQYSDGSAVRVPPIPGIVGNVDRDRLNGDDISIISR